MYGGAGCSGVMCPFVPHSDVLFAHKLCTMALMLWPLSFVQAAGKYKQKGRDYIVEDGDIILFKFNAGAGLTGKKKWHKGENRSCASRHWLFVCRVSSAAIGNLITFHASWNCGETGHHLKETEHRPRRRNIISERKQHFRDKFKRCHCLTVRCNTDEAVW